MINTKEDLHQLSKSFLIKKSSGEVKVKLH